MKIVSSGSKKRAFTLIELLVVISIIALLIGILLPALGRARKNAQALKDGAQLRQVHAALAVFATNNRDRYPVPSSIDSKGYTEGTEIMNPTQTDAMYFKKNRTAAIYSILIYNGNIVPEVMVSPAEPNGGIVLDDAYHYSFNTAQNLGTYPNDPDKALWDPYFRSVPGPKTSQLTAGQYYATGDANATGHSSYAHPAVFQGSGRPGTDWKNSFNANRAILADRGPLYSVGAGQTGSNFLTTPTTGLWDLAVGAEGKASDALRFAGNGKTWSGNVAYNDGHVSQENMPDPVNLSFSQDQDGATKRDNIFVDEQNEIQGSQPDSRSNIILRVWSSGIDNSGTSIDETTFAKNMWWDGKPGNT